MAASVRDCQEFDIGPFIEFTGAVDFTNFTTENLTPGATASAKIQECKAKCINDPTCGIWSVAPGNICRKYVVDGRSTTKQNGLVINPSYMYNSGFPDKTYSTLNENRPGSCKDACAADPKCNFFEHSLNRASGANGGRFNGVCKLNEVSSPHPTGYVKTYTCQLMECVKGRIYVGSRTQITFHATDLTFLKIPGAACAIPLSYTLSSDKSIINITRGGTFTSYTVSTIVFTPSGGGSPETLTVSQIPSLVCSPSALPFSPPIRSTTCVLEGIFECVKGKEFYGAVTTEFGIGINIKFDTTLGRLFLGVCTSPSSCDQCYLVNYTIDTNNAIGFTWTSPLNSRTYTFGLYEYIYDGTTWSISVKVKYTTTGAEIGPNTLTGSLTTASRMVAGACSIACPDCSVSICPTGSVNDNGVCEDDGSIPTCLSFGSEPSLNTVCPNPFTFTKFANVDDFSQQIVIEDEIFITLYGGVKTYYFSREGDSSGEYYIDTPYYNFYYSSYVVGGVKVGSLMKFSDSGNAERYIDTRYYFYKKTLIKPVLGSTQSSRYDTKDCLGNKTTNNITSSILYHCLMFNGIRKLKYYIVRKSTVSILVNRNETLNTFVETIDQMLSPYENLTSTQIINGTWSIDSTTDTLSINLNSDIPSILLEEYGYADFKKKDPIYAVSSSSGKLTKIYENELFYFIKDSQGILQAHFINSNQKISQDDHEYLKITRKDTDISFLVKRVSPPPGLTPSNTYFFRECDYSGNYLPTSSGIFDEHFFYIADDVPVRFSFMRQRTIDRLLSSSTINLPITETGYAGDFLLYESQLLSGLDDYNACATRISTTGRNSIDCTSVYDAASKCEETDDTVGFVYNYVTNKAYMIFFDEQFSLNTNRNSFTEKHDDLSDTRIVYNQEYFVDDGGSIEEGFFTTRFTNGYGRNVERTSILNLTHNIFPSDKMAAISSVPDKDNVNQVGFSSPPSNSSVIRVYDPGYPGYGNQYHYFNGDPNELISSFDFGYTVNLDERMFIRSNQPNIGGKIFRAIYSKNTLPTRYEGVGGTISTPVQINTLNDLQLKNGIIMNTFSINRITDYEKLIITETSSSSASGGVVTGHCRNSSRSLCRCLCR